LESITARSPWARQEEYVFPLVAAQAAKIVRAGGRVGVGGHGEIQGLQCHWEMWALAAGGMSPLEVIHAATLSGAEAIGLAQDLGSLEPGKLADLVILDKNPLSDIRNTNTVRFVMKNGELFKSEDLSEVWPVKKSPPKPWWVIENEELGRVSGGGRGGS
jgi:imidazolonepropionase-like amidohydrolase